MPGYVQQGRKMELGAQTKSDRCSGAAVAPPKSHWLSIYESEIRIMAGLSAERCDTETGGNVYGLLTPGDRQVIQLVTAPGPKAVHEPAHFQQDIEFFRRTCGIIDDSYGLKWLGNWHAHHTLGLDRPSTGDLAQVRSITTKNDFGRWCDIITVHERDSCFPPWNRCGHRARAGRKHLPCVRLNAFVYVDPRRGEHVRCRVRVLPGISPVRLYALSSGKLTAADLGEQASCFPLEQLLYEACNPPRAAAGHIPDIPAQIINHLGRLPFGVQKQIRLYTAQDMIIVAFPLADARTANIAYARKPPHTIRAVCVSDKGGALDDVTRLALPEGPTTTLDRIHALLMTSRERRPARSVTSVWKRILNTCWSRFSRYGG